MKNYVYNFGGGTADGDGKMKETLGGKGAGLAEMSKAWHTWPPGFTISTEVCNIFFENGNKVPTRSTSRYSKASRSSRSRSARSSGDPKNPLLVSVRFGAKFSMPGMMNTILNLGLNDETVEGLAQKTGNARFAYDSYRRFIQMFGDSRAMDIEHEKFDHAFDDGKKQARSVKHDTDLDGEDLQAIIAELQEARQEDGRARLPAGPARAAHDVASTPSSTRWWNPQALDYRKMEKHPGRDRHRRQRPGDGLRQHGRRLGAPASASPATRCHRRERASTASSC